MAKIIWTVKSTKDLKSLHDYIAIDSKNLCNSFCKPDNRKS
jgi:hypothetical protein